MQTLAHSVFPDDLDIIIFYQYCKCNTWSKPLNTMMRIVNSVTVVVYLRQELPHCWSENKASVCAEPKRWTLHVSISVATRTIHHLLLFLPSVSFHTHLPNAPFHDVQQVTLVQHIHVQCFFCCSVRQPWAQNRVILWPRNLPAVFLLQLCQITLGTKSCYSMAKTPTGDIP